VEDYEPFVKWLTIQALFIFLEIFSILTLIEKESEIEWVTQFLPPAIYV